MSTLEMNNLGIPPLAGICSYAEACKPGLSVEQSVALLRRFNFVLTRMTLTGAAHLPRVPEWEVKCGLGLHIWWDAEHSAAIRKRVGEMREPPLHLDRVPDARLEVWLDEVIRADTTLELLAGLYMVARPALLEALQAYADTANPIADHPTWRLLRSIIAEEQQMIAWGQQALAALARTEADQRAVEQWTAHLRAFLDHAGGIGGDLPVMGEGPLPAARSDGRPYEMDAVPRRDGRFTSSFDQSHWGVVEHGLTEQLSPDERAFVLLYRRLREMDVPEFMAPILYKTPGKPWDYYLDLSRQLWDEARHAMMGEVGLFNNGMAFYEYPIELEGSMALNTAFEPRDAHIALWAVEQALMARDTGKLFELRMAESSGDRLVTLFQDYDWADEVLHAQIGRRWLTPEFGGLEQLREISKEVSARWQQEMDNLKGWAPMEAWWPKFVEDLRQRRAAAANSAPSAASTQ